MLASRLLTALVLVPLVFLAVLKLPEPWFAALAGLVVLGAGWELARLAALASVPARLAVVVVTALLLGGLYPWRQAPWAGYLLFALAAWWVVNLVALLSGKVEPRPIRGAHLPRLAAGVAFLAGAWLALVRLHGLEHGPELVMFFLVLIWLADSAAYFSGRNWGRRKLAPHISPGKTVEGALGALVSAALFSLVLGITGWTSLSLPAAVLLGVVTVAVSIGGDLWESVLKRERGFKDSGRVLPGHGGVLDRIDSQIAAAPFFLAGLWLLGGRA
ncbi:MAG TPA: phosphatidate cytidylyltransferase [Thiolapillus brandeum]|uniref:Phosphatidate cytidylyltransferase n=1 Tax=Thiolapillus brandeum TaxID=1076588 RepID=A0A7C5IYD6_9GAMM|nr:phosphatidate cytidylyltransferase [Thiolapillus brandeum]